MSTRPSRNVTRPRGSSVLKSSLDRVASSRQAVAAKVGLDAEAPNPIFSNAAQRHALIEKAAYYRAEHRGFALGHELDDWLEAEREVDTKLFRGESLT